jgi:hypothetical protein
MLYRGCGIGMEMRGRIAGIQSEKDLDNGTADHGSIE